MMKKENFRFPTTQSQFYKKLHVDDAHYPTDKYGQLSILLGFSLEN